MNILKLQTMKKILLLLLTTFTLSCCNKDDDDQPKTELEKLPPATQTGANTFGCLLDGKAFLPGNFPNSTNCFYQFVDGNYYFALAFSKRDSQNNIVGIDLATNAKQIFQGETYQLFEYLPNNASGAYIYGLFENFTNNINSGELKITKLDEINHIVSGKFWFDVLDNNGVVHQIREGRFDSHYTN